MATKAQRRAYYKRWRKKNRLHDNARIYRWQRKHRTDRNRISRSTSKRKTARLTDSYLRWYLKYWYKIEHPTRTQIERRRTAILAKRTLRQFLLLSTSAKLCRQKQRRA